MSRIHRLVSLAVTLSVAGMACNNDGIGTPGAADMDSVVQQPPDLAMPGPFMTAPHTPYPQLSPHSGTVLPNINLVTITYSDYPYTSEVYAFGDKVFGSAWFKAAGSEYGVTSGTHAAKVVLPETAPSSMTGQGIPARINQAIMDGTAPPAGPGSMYLIYFPMTTSISGGGPGVACQDYLGYHYFARSPSGVRYAYGVVIDCSGAAGDTTSTASHELLEAATDPFTDAWSLDVGQFDHWVNFNQYEDGDMCEYLPDTTEDGVELQRMYSNAEAAAGREPCVPAPPGWLLFNVSPAPDIVPTVAAGHTTQITLTGWSAQPMKSWTLSVQPWGQSDFDPTARLSANSINNGLTVKVTLKVPPGTQSGSVGTAVVYSGPGGGRFWPVSVVAQ